MQILITIFLSLLHQVPQAAPKWNLLWPDGAPGALGEASSDRPALRIYERDRHGVGLAPGDPVLSTWPERMYAWLRVHGLAGESTGVR